MADWCHTQKKMKEAGWLIGVLFGHISDQLTELQSDNNRRNFKLIWSHLQNTPYLMRPHSLTDKNNKLWFPIKGKGASKVDAFGWMCQFSTDLCAAAAALLSNLKLSKVSRLHPNPCWGVQHGVSPYNPSSRLSMNQRRPSTPLKHQIFS